jgi:outer membrane lipoprotein-sorting protein
MKKKVILISLCVLISSLLAACVGNNSTVKNSNEIAELQNNVETLEKHISDVEKENTELVAELNRITDELSDFQAKIELYKYYSEYSRYRVRTGNYLYNVFYQPMDNLFYIDRVKIGEKSFKRIFEKESVYSIAVSKNDELVALTYCDNEGAKTTLEVLDINGNLISSFVSSDFEPEEDTNLLEYNLNIDLRDFTDDSKYLMGTMADSIAVGYWWLIEISSGEIEVFIDYNMYEERLNEIGYSIQ